MCVCSLLLFQPVWKLLVDMDPQQLVSCIDFRYISDALTEEEALDILQKSQKDKQQRVEQMLREGYPAYTTSCAWLGYTDQTLTQLCSEALAEGWSAFKVKVGADLDDDIRRCRLIRQMIGPEKHLMIDANQRWDVEQAVAWVTRLAEFQPLWIEEPTSPDDILGHAHISKALAPLGIGVASGEQCHNRVMFKQFLQASALQFVQIDAVAWAASMRTWPYSSWRTSSTCQCVPMRGAWACVSWCSISSCLTTYVCPPAWTNGCASMLTISMSTSRTPPSLKMPTTCPL